jgi:hypothetical protein
MKKPVKPLQELLDNRSWRLKLASRTANVKGQRLEYNQIYGGYPREPKWKKAEEEEGDRFARDLP